MKKIKIILYALFLIIMIAQAHASQNATQLPTASPYPGLTMLNNINSAFNTFQTNFSGSSAPSGTGSPVADQFWANTSTSIFNFYDGSNWLPLGKFSGSTWININAGVLQQAPTSTGSSNAYVVTYSPAVTALTVGVHYPFFANFQNTTAATENVNSLGAKAIKKQGGTALISGDIVNGALVDTVWDGTNFQMTSQTGNAASGTVTSIATNNGLTGGTITSSGTIGLATIGDANVMSNISGGTAIPVANSLSAIMDYVFGNTQGSVLCRDASSWAVHTPGTNGQALITQGAGANCAFATIASTTVNFQDFTGSGTWTKPSGLSSSSMVHIQGWGGGGGSQSTGDYGGGGGAYVDMWIKASSLGSTETVTIGGGGGTNANGGASTFGSWLSAPGGAAGASGVTGNNTINGIFVPGFSGGDGNASNGNVNKNSVWGGAAGGGGLSTSIGTTLFGGARCTQPGGGASAITPCNAAAGEIRVTTFP